VNAADRFQLLFGPYAFPALCRGDRATCSFLDTTVTITGWTGARIAWPLCRPVDNGRGRPTILLDEELARAVRHESATAIGHWWGVGRLRCCGAGEMLWVSTERTTKGAPD